MIYKKIYGYFGTEWIFLGGRLSIVHLQLKPRSWGIHFNQDLNYTPPAPPPPTPLMEEWGEIVEEAFTKW
jgi:hypothetical protein